MLEICPVAFCASAPRVRRVPRMWHSHSWLCSIQRATDAVRDRVTPRGSTSLRSVGFATSPAQIATRLESYSCTHSADNHIGIISLRKNIGGHPLGAIMLLRFSFSTKASRMSTYTNAAHNSRGICTYDFIGLKVPLESALAKKFREGGRHSESQTPTEFRRINDQA
jgi:hypothetical protein